MDKKNNDATSSAGHDYDLQNSDFRVALESLLAAYEPILSEDLALAKSPDQIRNPGEGPDCEAEVALATRIFSRFWNEKVALSLLPAEARATFGPIDRWTWCFRHIECCTIFGWLLCRGPRGIRAYSYYLNQYWRCVRQVIGKPVSHPPTAAETKDYQVLVTSLASAYQPYLQEQAAEASYPAAISSDVLSGKIDCLEDTDDAVAIFARALTPEALSALLGEEAYNVQRRDPFFWYCRCWCICALAFGCCLARARRVTDIYACLRSYFLCLRKCFTPLTCELTGPTGCTDEITSTVLPGFLVPITGTAGGGGFSHYILEWSLDNVTYNASNFYYPPIPPGNSVQGNVPVFGGLLGYLDTTLLNPGLIFIRLIASSVTGAQCVKTLSFSLLKKDVRILGVGGYFNLDSGWSDPNARFVETVPALCTRPLSTSEVSFGGALSVSGGAFVGGCVGKSVARYELDFKAGLETNCASGGWTKFLEVDYTTPAQNRWINWRTDSSTLTSYWVDDCFIPTPFAPFCAPFQKVSPLSLLSPTSWDTFTGSCQMSGLYTLRVLVTATDGSTYCDTQRIWLDNKPICVRIKIDAVPQCADLFVSQFAKPPDCSVPWSLPISGIVWDPYIDTTLPLSRPNDNLDYYVVTVTKQGGPALQIPIPGPGGSCFYGTSRVGSCSQCAGDPVGGEVYGTLAAFDLRAIDAICGAGLAYVPAGFALDRGDCCVYTFEVYAQDRTITSGGPHHDTQIWPVKICNDLKS